MVWYVSGFLLLAGCLVWVGLWSGSLWLCLFLGFVIGYLAASSIWPVDRARLEDRLAEEELAAGKLRVALLRGRSPWCAGR